MVEAEITCLCRMVEIKDLGLKMEKNQTRFVPEDPARASQELEVHRRIGGVSVRYVRRCEEIRSAASMPPPMRVRSRIVPVPPAPAPVVPPESPAPPRPPRAPAKHIEALADRLESRMVGLAGEIGQRLEGAVKEGLKGARAPAAPGDPHTHPIRVDEDTPTYIPDKIVGDLSPEVSVKTKKTKTKGRGVTDAADALRVAREKAPKKGKTRGKKEKG